jgi:hypothetical protein
VNYGIIKIMVFMASQRLLCHSERQRRIFLGVNNELGGHSARVFVVVGNWLAMLSQIAHHHHFFWVRPQETKV